MKKRDAEIRRQWRMVGIATTAASVMVVSVLIGWGIGTYLDARFGGNGLWLLAGLLLGAVAGMVEMFQMIRRAYLESKEP